MVNRKLLMVNTAPVYGLGLEEELPAVAALERRSGNAWALDASGAPVVVSDEDSGSPSHIWNGSAWVERGVQVRGAATALMPYSGASTDWGASDIINGISVAKSSVAIDGLQCVRLTFSGTSNSASTRRIYMGAYSALNPIAGYNLDDVEKGDLVTLVLHMSLSGGSWTAFSSIRAVIREYWNNGSQQIETKALSLSAPTAASPAKATPVKLVYRVQVAKPDFKTLMPLIDFVVPNGTSVAGIVLDMHVQLVKGAVADDSPFVTTGTAGARRDVEELILNVQPGRYEALIEDHTSKVWRDVETTGRLTIEPPNSGRSVKRVRLFRPTRSSIQRARRRRMAPDTLPTPLWTFKPTLANTTVDGNDGVSALDMGGGLSAAQSDDTKRPTRVEQDGVVYLDFVEGDFLTLTGVTLPDDRTVVVVFKAPDITPSNTNGSTAQCTILGHEGATNRPQLCFGGPTTSGKAIYANAVWTAHNQNATAIDAESVSPTLDDFVEWTVAGHTRKDGGNYQVWDLYQPATGAKFLNALAQYDGFITFGTVSVSTIGRRYDPGTTLESPAHFVGQLAEIRCYSPALTEAQRARLVTEELPGALPRSAGMRVQWFRIGAITATGCVAVAAVSGAASSQRARLIVSTNADLSSPVYTSSYAVATDIFNELSPTLSLFKITVPPATLTAGTLYYANVELE